jgi:hypothetical protein
MQRLQRLKLQPTDGWQGVQFLDQRLLSLPLGGEPRAPLLEGEPQPARGRAAAARGEVRAMNTIAAKQARSGMARRWPP